MLAPLVEVLWVRLLRLDAGSIFPTIAEVFSRHNGLVELGLFIQPEQNSRGEFSILEAKEVLQDLKETSPTHPHLLLFICLFLFILYLSVKVFPIMLASHDVISLLVAGNGVRGCGTHL